MGGKTKRGDDSGAVIGIVAGSAFTFVTLAVPLAFDVDPIIWVSVR